VYVLSLNHHYQHHGYLLASHKAKENVRVTDPKNSTARLKEWVAEKLKVKNTAVRYQTIQNNLKRPVLIASQ
jgi:hypothetical protein